MTQPEPVFSQTKARRWRKAQRHEAVFWQRIARSIHSGTGPELDWYGWKADQLDKLVAPHIEGLDRASAKVLEVGSGPVGIISYLKWGRRFAIDPLEDSYRANPNLTRLRDENVQYMKGVAEDIPFKDESFSFIILDNVLDHVQSPRNALAEVSRVLKPNGLVYLMVNTHAPWGTFVRSVLELFQVDGGHPHTFLRDDIYDLLGGNRLRVRDEVIEDHRILRKKGSRSGGLKSRCKTLLGIHEIQYHALCQKGPV